MSHKHRKVVRVASVAAALLSLSAVAVDPVIDIEDPTSGNVLYSDAFPFVQPISFTLHPDKRIGQGGVWLPAELKDVTVLDVRVDDVAIVNRGRRIRNPFTDVNDCASSLVASADSCVAQDERSATISVPWQVAAPGRYTIVVSAKIRGDDGNDVEIALAKTLDVEFAEPLTVADAFIQAEPR